MNGNNERALEAFVGELGLALEYLNKLETHLLDHMGTHPDNVNWFDVGTASHVKEKLREICFLLNLEEEE